jgi:hypothetical protein
MFAAPVDFSAVISLVFFFGLVGGALGLIERFLGS